MTAHDEEARRLMRLARRDEAAFQALMQAPHVGAEVALGEAPHDRRQAGDRHDDAAREHQPAGGGQPGATVKRKAKPNTSEPKNTALAASRNNEPHQPGERSTSDAFGSRMPRPATSGSWSSRLPRCRWF